MKYLFFLVVLLLERSISAMDLTGTQVKDEHSRPSEIDIERAPKKSRFEADEFTKKLCCMSCDPLQKFLQRLEAPKLASDTGEWTIVSLEKLYKVTRREIELCNLWQYDKLPHNRVRLGNYGNAIVECTINCLLIISQVEPGMNYGERLHILLKPTIAQANIFALATLVDDLQVPVLLHYIKVVILTYLLAETDINRLGCFLRICTQAVPRSLLDGISKEFLEEERSFFQKYSRCINLDTLAQKGTLQEVIALFHCRRVGESKYLKKIYERLPDIRFRDKQ